jgi:DNA polymerase
MPTSDERLAALESCRSQALRCTRCPGLVEARTQVVFGTGSPDARLMVVVAAPGRAEDEHGLPLAGRAAEVLRELLQGIGLGPQDVYVTSAVKCLPPDNRDPSPPELQRCGEYLARQVELIRPSVVCPLGSFATKLLRQDAASITTTHGRAEIRIIGRRAVRLYPMFHPGAALYQSSSLEILREDVTRLAGLLALGPPEQPAPEPESVVVSPDAPPSAQLGLF